MHPIENEWNILICNRDRQQAYPPRWILIKESSIILQLFFINEIKLNNPPISPYNFNFNEVYDALVLFSLGINDAIDW